MRLAVATKPKATRPPETETRNMDARPIDSAMVAARAPWSTKCSVVTKVTAEGRGSWSASPTFGRGSLLVRANLRARGHGERIAGSRSVRGSCCARASLIVIRENRSKSMSSFRPRQSRAVAPKGRHRRRHVNALEDDGHTQAHRAWLLRHDLHRCVVVGDA